MPLERSVSGSAVAEDRAGVNIAPKVLDPLLASEKSSAVCDPTEDDGGF